ncbi:uncharacterized protein AB675_9656 [Cyphellophora attinorum]|uniref:Putative membrane protein n=1 Tax=Cyphellophora attinorum TaxID=1664694 RepID=A0A0N1P2K5_9EURO|nr:uncharacterized protein AB675_9656 [Phialophora attinorum]KPI42557.1 putative membrane protein [Phialophora attinorum]
MKGIKKVLSHPRRSSEAQSENSLGRHESIDRHESVDSLNLERSPDRSSRSSPSRESQHSGYKKLLPGHAKRKRRKQREEELRIAAEEVTRGRTQSDPELPVPTLSRKASSVGDSSLLTDDSTDGTPERPPLLTHDSHAGLLTHSSPLVKTETLTDTNQGAFTLNHAQTLPAVREPPREDGSPSPKSPDNASTPALPFLGLIDKADTLRPEGRRNSISRLRAKSPARKIRDVFTKGNKSPRVSPERRAGESVEGVNSPLGRSASSVGLGVDVSDQTSLPSPQGLQRPKTVPNLEAVRPFTPPAAITEAPLTTVTPPTPTDTRFDNSKDSDRGSVKSEKDDADPKANPNITVSPSGNMISHRRVRSTSSVSKEPSKLSMSMNPPLTPTAEEVKTPGGNVVTGNGNVVTGNRNVSGGSFFSSWVSAAQNAANTFSSLTNQNRSRAGTTASDPAIGKGINGSIREEPEDSEDQVPARKSAIETMGAGDLNFEHLGLDDAKSDPTTATSDSRDKASMQRDVAAAKEEDAAAKRAVSAAYEKPEPTPVAEIPDPMNSLQQAKTVAGSIHGDTTPPNGSLFEGEYTHVKRTNSVRSRLANRRSRGSTAASGQSAIGALMGASTSALANPASGPRLSGFAIAPKQRNRTFHQQFRSVPEDDYLIEDYSCALQKEILLAGRIYISEGHICFSSNILGWVTTIVISFDEVVSIEKENTALVIPNAIAVQTLHARHTFRSLLSREATYDLLIGIWKVSHPASFQKSQVGKEIIAEEATKEATGTGNDGEEHDEDDESGEDESDGSADEEDDAPSFVGSSRSGAGSERLDEKSISRKPSGFGPPPTAPSLVSKDSDPIAPATLPSGGTLDTTQDFPGPATHAPTDCNDASTHYEIVIKDEVIAAPLGKVYSLLYGPQSGAFMRKFLIDECKSQDLVLEDDKKGLGAEKTSRSYNYIKPLGGSIGPKQTKTITTEDLDFYDLQRAVTVTCSTQTPDVPSGGAFTVKTRYCLTWAAGNQTRLQMNCVIEWSAKSWLKGPIEKGAKDGQGQYGDSLVKFLKTAVGRPRGLTKDSKGPSKKKKRRSGLKRGESSEKAQSVAAKDETWGLLEPLHGPLGPVVDLLRPVLKTNILITVLFVLVIMLWFRTPISSGSGLAARPDRLAAYEEMWRKEESELWSWLESRAGVDTIAYQAKSSGRSSTGDDSVLQKQKQKQRQKVLKGQDVEMKLREETMAAKEVEEAIRVTRERLEVLEEVVSQKRRAKADKAAK